MEKQTISLDEEEPFRPLEQYDKEDLLQKRFEKMDLRMSRIEAMLQKLAIGMKKLIDIEQVDIKESEGSAPKDKGSASHTAEKIEFFERHEQRLLDQTKKLTEQEKELQEIITKRREEDAWFNMVMHDCKYKVSEKDDLMCMKTNKFCNFKNCPLKDQLKHMLG